MIKMDANAVRNKAKDFRNEASMFSDSINRMDRKIVELEPIWEGEASKAYAQRFADLKPAFKNTVELIDELCKNLERIANRIERVDTDIANEFNKQG